MDELLNTAPCGFLCCAANGTIHQVNATLADWLGYAPDELAGRSIESILSIGGRIFYQTHISPLLRLQGRAEEIYFSLKAKNGDAVAVLTNAVRRERAGASVDDFVFLPMRQRREYEDELLQAKKVADEASQAKARFLSMMSHELRTPLNSILGFGQLLEMDLSEPFETESVGQILKAGRHLLELINEVLDMSRIEAGMSDMAIAPLPVADVMAEAFLMAQPLATRAAIEFKMQADVDNEYYVQADPGRLRQVLLNLIANGIKYNREGGSVTLGCERAVDEDSGRELMRFVVSDTGLGIAADDLSKLFVPFERLGREGSAIEGTGLGLALCHRLVEAMGGQIGVQSVEGQGSRFCVELPAAPRPDAVIAVQGSGEDADDAAPPPQQEAVLLYIEDDESNLKLMQHVMRHRPAVHLLTAKNGETGLQMAQNQDQAPDVILLDLQLPDIAGDIVLDRLRSDERTRHIPVVMLSADATTPQVNRLLEAGAHEYLTKPINVREFLRILDTLIAQKPLH